MSTVMMDQGILRGFTRLAREWFFALAFTSIGLETNFREFGPYFKGGKPITLYRGRTGFPVWLMFYVF